MKVNMIGGLGIILLLVSCQLKELSKIPPTVEYLTSEMTTSLNLPFSDAVRVGNMLYLSGQIGNIPGKTELAPGGIAAETKQTKDLNSDILHQMRDFIRLD